RTRPVGAADEHLGLETIPKDAVVIDLRSRAVYEAWHAPGALHLEFFDALRSYESFARDRTFVLYCEVGQKSAHLAELMRRAGLHAYHVQGGLRTLQRHLHEDELVIP
ncbi:MAG TPA: rhodanese-like domain-containing protein, partial [Candidatus Eisenbacteria bacterium]|nr:rhodanese-like domain-containing protein [Candidatus Eisenbacteria bacterium]